MTGWSSVASYAGRVPVVVEVVTVIAAPPAVVFDLELDVDVHTASLARSGETATTSTGRRRLHLGDEVTLRARHLGLRWRMTSRITAHARPHRFVDEQVRGPFRALHHEHLFEDLGTRGTRMTDRMSITAPAGALGEVVAHLVLAPYLRRLLRHRAAHVGQAAEAGGRPPA
ncbi:SRPBCC family protein [Kineococcus radiotolerans]|uniref:SRPBCC family protein n=1 Tax=Kineococcus radiotolerans TaxID=131568 RepID=UPI00161E4D2D